MLPQGPQKVNPGPSFNGLFEGQEGKCCLAQVRIRPPTPQPRSHSPRRGPAGTSQPACHPLWPMHMPRPSSRAGKMRPREMRPDWRRAGQGSDSPQSPTHKHLLQPQPLPHPRWLSVPRMAPAKQADRLGTRLSPAGVCCAGRSCGRGRGTQASSVSLGQGKDFTALTPTSSSLGRGRRRRRRSSGQLLLGVPAQPGGVS